MSTESFPLSWPVGRGRTPAHQRKDSQFNTKLGKARDAMLSQLRLMGARNIVISTNIKTYMRGGQEVPYADQTGSKEDPGVAVYYTWQGEQYALACDKWKSATENLQALNKTVEAIRGIERWGTGEMMKAAFTGFKGIPETTSTKSCWDVLDLIPTKRVDLIDRQYRVRVKSAHPDTGGSDEKFIELNNAYDQAITYANS